MPLPYRCDDIALRTTILNSILCFLCLCQTRYRTKQDCKLISAQADPVLDNGGTDSEALDVHTVASRKLRLSPCASFPTECHLAVHPPHVGGLFCSQPLWDNSLRGLLS